MNFSKQEESVLAYIGTYSHVWAPNASILNEQKVICPEYLKVSKVYYYKHDKSLEVRCGMCCHILRK